MALVDKASLVIFTAEHSNFIFYGGYVVRSKKLKPRYYIVASFTSTNNAAIWYATITAYFKVDDSDIKYLTRSYLNGRI